MNPRKPPLPRPPLFLLIFVSVFGFIGLAVLIFLWSAPRDGFGAPPLLFRVVGSGIAIAFMALGFGLPWTALRRRAPGPETESEQVHPGTGTPGDPLTASKGYRCHHCGAALDRTAEVSPSGDVKCSYCMKWWNIHH
jgi:hypothetical protein